VVLHSGGRGVASSNLAIPTKDKKIKTACFDLSFFSGGRQKLAFVRLAEKKERLLPQAVVFLSFSHFPIEITPTEGRLNLGHPDITLLPSKACFCKVG